MIIMSYGEFKKADFSRDAQGRLKVRPVSSQFGESVAIQERVARETEIIETPRLSV